MRDQWVVLLNTVGGIPAYGPMGAKEAEAFAEFLTASVDPAIAVPLRSPVAEMLAFYRHEQDRNNCTHSAGCPVHPLYCPPAAGMPGCTGDADCPKHPGRSEAQHLLEEAKPS